MTGRLHPALFKLGEDVMVGNRKWRVGAVLWLGERYYMLTRRRNPNLRDTEEVALMPEMTLERVHTGRDTG